MGAAARSMEAIDAGLLVVGVGMLIFTMFRAAALGARLAVRPSPSATCDSTDCEDEGPPLPTQVDDC